MVTATVNKRGPVNAEDRGCAGNVKMRKENEIEGGKEKIKTSHDMIEYYNI